MNQKSLRYIFAGVATLAFVAISGCATDKNLQPQGSNAGGTAGFDLADTNHDGKLSRDEASDFLTNEIFDSRDLNHDGKMTEKEWSAGDTERAADFKKRDTNHDGIVTRDEALKYARAHGMMNNIMREADKNGDGSLDRAEVKAYYKSRETPQP
jgi:Ca2+-binding EF-hand superfamily protein